MTFEFATASRIIFGAGSIRQLRAAISPWGSRVLLVLGKSGERAAPIIRELRSVDFHVEVLHVPTEPTISLVLEGQDLARSANSEMVIAMGGGSALDAGKAIAALVRNPGPIQLYLEVIGRGNPLQEPSLPLAAIPTTAGTGSEVTRNAVLKATPENVKISLRGPFLLPRLALVDPELTYDLPPAVTAASGMDALVQLIEPFVSVAANPITDALCRDGIPRIARFIRRACEDGRLPEPRAEMALGALYSGMTVANSKLGAVHGFAGPIGGMFPAPHGAVCARLVPSVMQANLNALRSRMPDAPLLKRFDVLAQLLTGRSDAGAEDGVAWLHALCTNLQIPALRTFGMQATHFPEIASRARISSSMQGNPIALTDAELTSILAQAL